MERYGKNYIHFVKFYIKKIILKVVFFGCMGIEEECKIIYFFFKNIQTVSTKMGKNQVFINC